MQEDFFEKSKEVLKKNKTSVGVIAGDYYREVWGRDGLITSLGLVASGDEELVSLAKLTINTITKYQNRLGQLPNFVSLDLKRISFGRGGCVDTSLWYPIAVLNYYKVTKDEQFLRYHAKRIDKAVNWVLALDQNGDGLIEINEGADWMDCLLRQGRVLYDNVLLYAALYSLDKIREVFRRKAKYKTIGEKIKENINLIFWPEEKNRQVVGQMFGYGDTYDDFEIMLQNETRKYYYADAGLGIFDPRCDVFANVLAILFDVANEEKKKLILKHFEEIKAAEPYPVRVLHPSIQPDDAMWFRYFRKTKIHFPWLQEPGNYHNGGIWPFIGGFYVMALVKEGKDAAAAFKKLIEVNKLGSKEEWEFPEWVRANGELLISSEGIPRYSPHQSWSASMLILANKWLEEGPSSLI